ncbi:MAG: ferredoxin [Thermodesulfobacteriota bacterium]
MKVHINELCMGDRNCHQVCPEVFGYSEDQLQAFVKMDIIPDGLKDKVRQAAEECGADAIIIEEDE